MNESASFMEVPEMKESVRPTRSKFWAIVRFGFGGLVLFALGGTTFINLKQIQILSAEVSQLKTALQGSPDIAPLRAQLTTLQQQFEASQIQLSGMADKAALAALQQKIEALDKQQNEQTASIAALKAGLSSSGAGSCFESASGQRRCRCSCRNVWRSGGKKRNPHPKRRGQLPHPSSSPVSNGGRDSLCCDSAAIGNTADRNSVNGTGRNPTGLDFAGDHRAAGAVSRGGENPDVDGTIGRSG